ncbi:Olfactory receptor 51E1 [Merluccius polli]|uniref:Olfactory receptor n=1 Tax=Merluccius polli TaxID=89951 RepID=A0AA47MER1_MERPO|nr:Olfactory receptor 51E1 [Merluccius polli]
MSREHSMTFNVSQLVGHGSNMTLITLQGFRWVGKYKYVYFFMLLFAYIFIMLSDLVVLYLISSQSSLHHQPMFIFIAALLLNSMVGSSTILPKLLIDILSVTEPTISPSMCISQAFFIYFFGASGFTLMSVMAYDRYMSICRPLQYHTLITMTTVRGMLGGAWLAPACLIGGATLLTSRVPLCKLNMNRLYCNIYSLAKQGCGDILIRNIYGMLSTTLCVLLPSLFVFYSYGRILAVCMQSSKVFMGKALQTCLPHLLVFINYFIATSFEVISSRMDANPHSMAPNLVSLIILIPTICNPIIYGFKTKDILRQVKRLLGLPNAN